MNLFTILYNLQYEVLFLDPIRAAIINSSISRHITAPFRVSPLIELLDQFSLYSD